MCTTSKDCDVIPYKLFDIGDLLKIKNEREDFDNIQEKLEFLALPYQFSKSEGEVIGNHNGAHFFTIGQRKGLNIGGYDKPLFVLSTDIVNNVKIESKSGDLINAIRASIAVPGVLTPTYVNDNLCVDGGLIDPVPLQSIIDMGSEQTIAVNLYGLQNSKKRNDKYNIVDIVDRSAKIMLNNVTHLSFKNNEPNILIEPPIDRFYGWDFHKANELIDIGYSSAKKILGENKELFI